MNNTIDPPTGGFLNVETRHELMVAQKSTEAALDAAQQIDMRRLPRALREHVHDARELLRNANTELKAALGN